MADVVLCPTCKKEIASGVRLCPQCGHPVPPSVPPDLRQPAAQVDPAPLRGGQLLRRTFEIDTICPRCKSPLRLIALIETEDTVKKILSAMGLPTEAPKPYPARPPPAESGGEGGDWLN